jgi:hypothetical protein
MSRVKTVIVLGNSGAGKVEVRAANRCKSKHCWFEGSLVENDLPHYRVESNPPVTHCEIIPKVEFQNKDDSMSSCVDVPLDGSVWDSLGDYGFSSSEMGSDYGSFFWN